ncbi:Purine permease [Parasponia andersonii]|uniref:Probable purine permease n=1 Tax=Parasponia andersonii TaxID=3476 RepID=A0A2P5ATT7_PARAD|nr:Purine permease [Parasponia andersonii]
MVKYAILSAQEANEADSSGCTNVVQSLPTSRSINYFQWLKVTIYAFLLISGQSAAMLLGRLYYDKGGNSKWLGTLVQLAGFPILLPYYCVSGRQNEMSNTFGSAPTSSLVLVLVCVFLGIVLAADCFLYSIGLLYLPVSTYSLISASQLAFNAFFSSFLNSQKFTPYIVNSLVLLTISSTLLVFQADSEDNPEFAIEEVLKRETFSVVVLDITIWESLLATCVSLVGLFASGEWKDLQKEMYAFQLGKVSYVMTLAGTAISWQAFFIGTVGLILEVSSLFSNANYLEGYDSKTHNRDANGETRASPT